MKASRQLAYLTARLGLRHLKVVSRLQGHPVLRFVAEPVGEAERGVARDGAPAAHDLRDPVGGYVNLLGQLGRCYAESLKLVRQGFARVMCRSSQRVLFSEPTSPVGSPLVMDLAG